MFFIINIEFVSCALQCTVSLSSAKTVKKRVKGLLETETNLSLEEKSTYEVKYILLKMFTRALKQGNSIIVIFVYIYICI